MPIFYEEKQRLFKLDTPNTSYVLGVVDEENFLGHVYYGKKIRQMDVAHLLRMEEEFWTPSKCNRERLGFYDSFPFEYPTGGLGDFREGCLSVQTTDGFDGLQLQVVSHEIMQGKPALKGLPAAFGKKDDCETLIIHCKDAVWNIKVDLYYTAFSDVDVITRSVCVENQEEKAIFLKRIYSACLDMDNKEFEMISLHGGWARERHIQRKKVGYGRMNVSSFRGESSHQEHPFIALVTPETTQEQGEVYAMNFVYSGNFIAQAELNQFDSVRMSMGIHTEHFCWKLEKGESFQAPEVVMVYSANGLDKMTQTFHDFYRTHLIRSEYKDKKRPILINNWEATYFDFNTDKLLDIAREASKLGIEMLVMDDGWFGKRNNDDCALGDWIVNEKKLPGGLSYLVEEVNKLGMQFGIWVEPEMISPDSDLYRAHPDWAIAIPERNATLCRAQYVLDLSRKEVRDYIYDLIAGVLRSANITYVKWDMNRQLSDLASAALPADRQGELSHRYMLGVYEMQERLVHDFPHLLLENCSGGGARFDPGMLYYSPQIWCSDDTDAIERLLIQEGTSLVYPLSAMGAHVSDCPNHSVGRVTPFATRGDVALAGTFGYELDVTKISKEDRELIPKQVETYHKYHDLIQAGDYYRIASYSQNHQYDCWEVASKDKTEVLVTFVQVFGRARSKSRRICLKGLQADKQYRLEGTEQVYAGDTLMYAGIQIPNLWGDYQSRLLYFKQVNEE